MIPYIKVIIILFFFHLKLYIFYLIILLLLLMPNNFHNDLNFLFHLYIHFISHVNHILQVSQPNLYYSYNSLLSYSLFLNPNSNLNTSILIHRYSCYVSLHIIHELFNNSFTISIITISNLITFFYYY